MTLAHERLIDAWQWLRRLVNENREAIALQNEIADDAREWDANQREASYLYTGARLATAREQLDGKKIVLSGLAQKFVESGIRAQKAQRQKQQQRTLLFSVFAVALIISTILLIYDPLRHEVYRQQSFDPPPILLLRSETVLGDGRSDPQNPTYLPLNTQIVESFYIEPYEVTNARYWLCVQASACSSPNAFKSTFLSSENAHMPVVNVTAVQARDFCQWLGRQLPTESEWERAARGTQGATWPWGTETPSATRANLYYGSGLISKVQPSGSYNGDKSNEGVYDLAGNVAEWTRSPFDLNKSDWSGSDGDLPVNLAVKGGDATTRPAEMGNSIAYRLAKAPFSFDELTGFRCVAH